MNGLNVAALKEGRRSVSLIEWLLVRSTLLMDFAIQYGT